MTPFQKRALDDDAPNSGGDLSALCCSNFLGPAFLIGRRDGRGFWISRNLLLRTWAHMTVSWVAMYPLHILMTMTWMAGTLLISPFVLMLTIA